MEVNRDTVIFVSRPPITQILCRSIGEGLERDV